MVSSRVAWVGRLTDPKGEIAYRIITAVAPKFPDIEFTIAGGPVTERFSERLDDNVKLLDFIANVEAVFAESDLVIGAGRVPIEAMRYGLPVIAVGENRYIGTIKGPLSLAADLMQARRITMFPNTRPAKFWRKTSGFYLRYCKIRGKDF